MSEGDPVSQQAFYVPAQAGWYARPGDPPDLLRHWDGEKWLCEVQGPIRDHFNHLRSIDPDVRTPAQQETLRTLTRDLSTIEDLVLVDPRALPPLVLMEPEPAPGFGVGDESVPRKRRAGRALLLVMIALVVLAAAVLGIAALTGKLPLAKGMPTLNVGSCVTLSYPSGASDSKSVAWTDSGCTTAANGPVSFVVVSKLSGPGQCDPDSQYVQTFSGKNRVENTYCLMENLAEGACVFQDAQGFLFDVPCTDSRALVKVTKSVAQGSGVDCGGLGAWRFPSGNHTYCLAKP